MVDVGGGHGLLAQAMLLLDDTSPSALIVDRALPPSSVTVHDALVAAWPRLAGRVAFLNVPLEHADLHPDDIVVSSHACGALTDRILARAAAARARVAVLPCCHDLEACDPGSLAGWVDPSLAIDINRANAPRSSGLPGLDTDDSGRDHAEDRLLLGAPEGC